MTHKVWATYGQGQSPPSFRIDEEQGRNCEYDLHSTVAQRSVQSLGRSVADVLEDC